MVVDGAGTVVVLWLTPTHEQALEYLTLPEHAEAYVGIEVGFAVTGLAEEVDVSIELIGCVGNSVATTVEYIVLWTEGQ